MAALVAFAAACLAAQAQAAAPESAIKAAYLYKFAPFVEWPASAFASQSSPFYLCVVGDDPLGVVLDQAVSGQRVDAHPMTVRRLRKAEVGSGCHILYLGPSAAGSSADTFRNLRGAPVLTVADHSRNFQGAVIRFIVQNGRVRFDIDTAAAAANGVTISSKLLNLAISVRPGG